MFGTIICVAVVIVIIVLSRSGISPQLPRRRPRPPVPGLRNTEFFRPDPDRDGYDGQGPDLGKHHGSGGGHHGHHGGGHSGGGHGGGHH